MADDGKAEDHVTHGSGEGLLSLRQMEVFHTVMQARSITGASKVLNVSQPALSRTIRRIEDLLGIALFARDRNGLVPTSEALEIFQEIDPLIRQLTGVGTQIGRIARGETAVFRVGSTASVARALVPQALRTLSVEVPGIELFFDVLPVDQIEEYLITGRGEAVVTIASPDHPLIAVEQVGRVNLVAVIHRDHSLASAPMIRAADLADMDFIAFAPGGAHQTVVDRFLSREKLKVNTRAVARFSDTALALANEAMGIVLVDYVTTLGPVGSNLVVRPIENAPQFSVSVLWNRRRSHSANLRKLIEILSRRLADLAPLT
ncbi:MULTISPECIES: LysR family transcriptional regulator [Agrobacterium]|jgi:DNA-binding transcriptional LysR family regulator|uniref:LysR family transcriptional regulator n=1 Tax=Agrobacterium TaxID=357 RepID=UPI000DDA0A3D|nr:MULTISPECIES: LysR family transcriptional regulator [Agrobacterium]UHS58260.1 LysR family transcriptional regulator [Agrobacterium vaccinii]